MKHFRTCALRGALMASAGFIALSAQAADPQVESLLAKMRTAYHQVKSAKYVTEGHYGQNVFRTTFEYSAPTKLRVSITVAGQQIQGPVYQELTNGKTIYVKAANASDYTSAPYTLEGVEKDLPANLESLCFFDWDRQLSTAPGKNMQHSTFKIEPNQTWNGKTWTVLQETASSEKVVCSYYVDPKTHFIWRTVVKPMTGGNPQLACDCRITQLDLAAKISDSIFEIVHV